MTRGAVRNVRRLPLAFAAAAACLAILIAPAQAKVPIYSFTAQPSSTTHQAGAHPDVAFVFEIGNRQQQEPNPCDCEDARNVTVHLPTGLIGNPHSTPQCTIAQFTSNECPPDSQVGVSEDAVTTDFSGEAYGFVTPVYNLTPPPNEPGLLAFETVVSTPVFLNVSARTNSDYGLDTTISNIAHFLPLAYSATDIWGVPAAPVHSKLRFGLGETPILLRKGENFLCSEDLTPATQDPTTIYQFCEQSFGEKIVKTWHNAPDGGGAVGDCTILEGGCGGPGYAVESESPEEPFFQNPTTCGETSLATSLDILSYDGSESHADSSYPPTTGCNELTFNPSLFAHPTIEEADSPSGINVDLKAPMFESPKVPSPSEIRSTVVTLPEGFTINSGAADGKTACADSEAKFGTTEEARCPEFAKLGTLEVHSPVLPGTLPGAIYIGKPLPGNRYRLFLTFDGFGTHVKLAGTVHPDPVSGRLVTEFRNLPQFPFEDFNLHFFGGERGILATPTQCGTYPVSTEFEPWDGTIETKTSTQYFTIDSGPGGSPCPGGPRPFAPSFKAASTANTAGSHTDFWLQLTRRDGEQNLTALNVTTPPGFSATLAGVPYCPEAAIEAAMAPGYSGLAESEHPSCPAASQVGEAFAGAGVGTHPFYAPGKVYLAGPYKGAPLSLVVITPAVSGPYDLGDVVVRTALRVNPETAQVTAVSDPLPQILEGVTLRLRSILVKLTRPNFALNPTDCEPFAVGAKVSGSEGATASPTSPFQVANCARLRFAPKLAISLKGGTRRAQHPALKAVLTMPPGGANIASAQVTLPHSAFLDQGHINKTCSRPQLASHSCPASSVYGYAKAETPLLDKPLEGPVYLGTGFGYKLPALVADLNGQIEVLLHGKVDTGKNGGIRNTFEVVPDAPVTRFTLEMQGGAKGLIVNSENLCSPRAKTKAIADFTAQNGRVSDTTPTVANSCGARAKKHKRRPGRARVAR